MAYALFVADQYYPCGGASDFQITVESKELAFAYFSGVLGSDEYEWQWYSRIVSMLDLETFEITEDSEIKDLILQS